MQFTGLKQRVHAGERIFRVAVSCPFDRSRFQEILRQGPYNEQRRVEFCGMAEEHGVHVQFRIRHTRHTYAIGNYPDPGPCGVLLPQTERGSTVAEALQSFYYPPRHFLKTTDDSVAYVVKAFEGTTIAVCAGTETPGKRADMGITIFQER